ncbi:MAG: exodeoxyribonuclease VII small subunit [Anaerolineae bacterium]|nr:exodeoxyribonuclease VII small subunit [Anaerolineae bacterium]
MTDEMTPLDLDFETAYRELQSLVERLESGELTLDQSVALYERGRQLVAFCGECLDRADLRVNRLVGDAATGLSAERLE